MFLLDTNIISELRRPSKAAPSVLRWANSVSPDTVFLSSISVLEIEIGVLRSLRRDSKQGAMLRDWLETAVLPSFRGRILAVDQLVVRRCAPLHLPDPKPQHDALIAATALTHGLRLVTRNVKDFASMDVTIVNPFEY